MIDLIVDVSTIVFNLISSAALLASAWWFYNRGSLNANITSKLGFKPMGNTTRQMVQVGLDVQNVGNRDAWLRQTVMVVDRQSIATFPEGPIPRLRPDRARLFTLQDDDLAIVPGSSASFILLLEAPAEGEIMIVRFFQFTGRGFLTISGFDKLDAALQAAGDNYYFDEAILDPLQRMESSEG